MNEDISQLVYQRVVRNEPGEVSLDSKMFRVFAELDGQKNIGTIAKNLGVDVENIKEIIARLLQLNIIALADEKIPVLSEDFLRYLTDQLTLATGPMAEVLIADAVSSLGYTQSNFPKYLTQELVELLAHSIYREEKRGIFKQNLSQKIFNEEV